jgi:hypothetical protein
VSKLIRIRHGTKPDLAVDRATRLDDIINARCGTRQQPARHDEEAAGQDPGGERRKPGTFLLATTFMTFVSNFNVFDLAGKSPRPDQPTSN